jgi:hypothetical protein
LSDDPAMQPLKGRPPYPYSDDELRQVARDAYVSWQANRYPVPWQYVGKEVWVREQAHQTDLGATMFFQLVSARYERGSILLTRNKSYGDWGSIFGDPIIATAILDRLLHHSTTINIRGESYRLKDRRRAGLLPRAEVDNRRPPWWR